MYFLLNCSLKFHQWETLIWKLFLIVYNHKLSIKQVISEFTLKKTTEKKYFIYWQTFWSWFINFSHQLYYIWHHPRVSRLPTIKQRKSIWIFNKVKSSREHASNFASSHFCLFALISWKKEKKNSVWKLLTRLFCSF